MVGHRGRQAGGFRGTSGCHDRRETGSDFVHHGRLSAASGEEDEGAEDQAMN